VRDWTATALIVEDQLVLVAQLEHLRQEVAMVAPGPPWRPAADVHRAFHMRTSRGEPTSSS
jgi:hypothetical protein